MTFIVVFKIMSVATAPTDEEFINFLVSQIVNLPEGMACFLCKTTYSRECIWNEIGEEMLVEGNKILAW